MREMNISMDLVFTMAVSRSSLLLVVHTNTWPDSGDEDDDEPDATVPSDRPRPVHKKKAKRVKKSAAVQTDNKSGGDQVLANSIVFLRTDFWYTELCASISDGDMGRVWEVLKVRNISSVIAHSLMMD